MKGQMVGDAAAVLLWPDNTVMSELRRISRPYNTLVSVEAKSADLLWPSSLINEQARLRKQKNPARTIALVAFIISLILVFIAGPVQLILIATMLDYNWTTTVYYSTALHYLLPISSLVAALAAVSVVLARRSHPHFTRTVATLASGTLAEIGLLWLFGCVIAIQPHTLSLIFIIVGVVSIVAALFIHRQYLTQTENGQPMKIYLGFLLFVAAFEILLGPLYIIESAISQDSGDYERLVAAQSAARIDDVPEILSNMTYALCESKYQIVYLSEKSESGIFECSESHDVYSVESLGEQNLHSIRGAATYLGTTHDKNVSLAFPTAYYLYRSMPKLPEDELALMVSAHSERELVDNYTEPLLHYWQAHHDRDLLVTMFYNDNISSINYVPPDDILKTPTSSTRNYILMAARGIMAMAEQLPSGNTYRQPFKGEMINYIFEPDKKLIALGELGSRPELYSQNSRDALVSHRLTSIRLDSDTDVDIDYNTLRDRLTKGFTTRDITTSTPQ